MFNLPFGNFNISQVTNTFDDNNIAIPDIPNLSIPDIPDIAEITPQLILERSGIPVTTESLEAQAKLLEGATQEKLQEALANADAVGRARASIEKAANDAAGVISQQVTRTGGPNTVQASDMERPFAGAYPGDTGSDNVRDYIIFTAYSNDVAGYTKMETVGSQSQGGEPEGTVQLYIPESLTVNSQVGYRNTDGGSIAGTIGNLGSDGDDNNMDVLTNLASQIIGQTGQQLGDTGGVLAQTQGLGVGAANRTVLFEGVEFRTFSYAYEFLPKSWEESDMLRKIIKFFRIQMLPEIRGNGNTFKTPNWFSIEYMIDGKPTEYLNKIKPSVCTGCDVSYGGNGQFAMFQSDRGEAPAPALINLTLTFQEVQVVSTRDAAEGY